MKAKVMIYWNASSICEIEVPDGTTEKDMPAAMLAVFEKDGLPECITNPTIEMLCAKTAVAYKPGTDELSDDEFDLPD